MLHCTDCDGRGERIGVRGGEVELARCTTCRLVFQIGWKDRLAENLYDYYGERLGWTEERLHPALNRHRIQELLTSTEAKIGGRRLLDVGCGAGGIVKAAQELGWEARGIELSESAVALCRRFGLDCSVTDFFDPAVGDGYDLVVMSELIEHVPEPSAFLRRAEEVLAPHGLIYVTTPNYASLGRMILNGDWRVIHPEHLSYFTPRTLRACAEAEGLEVERLWTSTLTMSAIKKLLRRVVPMDVSTSRAHEQEFRESLEGSPVKRTAKRAVNGTLRVTGSGEQMKAFLRAEPRADASPADPLP